METDLTKEKKMTAIPEMKVETRLLYQRGRDIKPGEFISYETLSELIGCDIQGQRGRGYLATARHRLLKDHGINLECVHSKGIKRMEDKELFQIGESSLRHIQRTSKLAAEKMRPVDLSCLADAEKTRHLALMSGLNMISHASSLKEVKRLEPMVQQKSHELPVGKVLDLLQEAQIR